MKIKVEVSARHIHLCKEDFVTLFAKDELTVRNSLSQKGEFASNETVEVVGPDNRLKKVRVLGPFRDRSQLELSKTDCLSLGINAPLQISGTHNGALIKIVGPKGSIMSKIAMIAMRHIHLSSKSAKKFGIKDGIYVSAQVSGDRAVTFGKAQVRVSELFTDYLHLDTDEGNAAGITGTASAVILKD